MNKHVKDKFTKAVKENAKEIIYGDDDSNILYNLCVYYATSNEEFGKLEQLAAELLKDV